MNNIIIQIDKREKKPLIIDGYECELVTLPVGDYGIKGFSDWNNPGLIIERKSVVDLAQSLGRGRERFKREIQKMRAFRSAWILIEGPRNEVELGLYESRINPKSILASLDAIAVRCGVHVEWAGSRGRAAVRLQEIVRQFVGGIEREYKTLQAVIK